MVATLTVVDPLNMLLILLGPRDFGGDGFDSFGGGSDFGSGDKLPEVRTTSFDSGSSGGGGTDPSTNMPTCPQGKLPFYDGRKWICRAQGTGDPDGLPTPTPNPGAGGGSPAPTTPAPTGGSNIDWDNYSPAMVRQASQGQSEDWQRYDDATISGWGQFYNAAASRAAGRPQFKSMRGAPGWFDKPTECPPGQGPSGPNETDPCTSAGYGGESGGGGGGGGGAQTPAPAPAAPVTPKLSNYDPRQFTYGNTWGEQNQAGGPQTTTTTPQTGGPDPKPTGGAGTLGGCPPGQVVNPCLKPPCPCGPPGGQPSPTGPATAFSDPGRAFPGSSTGTSSGMLLTTNRSLNI